MANTQILQVAIFLSILKHSMLREFKCGKPGHNPLCPYYPLQESYYEGDKATYHCKERFGCYFLLNQTRTCLQNGIWSGNIPLCYAAMTIKGIFLTPPISGSNMNFLVDKNRTTCIQSNSTTNIAVWEIQIETVSAINIIKVDLFTDSPVDVDILVTGRNNTFLCGRAQSYLSSGSSLVVVCLPGLKGSAIRITQRSDRNMSFKLCEINVYSSSGVATCLKADTPLNAQGQKQVGTKSTMYVFTCNQGYELIGEKSVHCQSNGTWSPSSTICKKRSMCESLPYVANGILNTNSTSVNSSAWLVCNEGFKPLTDDKIYCLPTGKWSSLSLHCVPIECNTNPFIPFGRGFLIDGNSIYGSRLQIKCDLGYVAMGSSLRQCQQDASWGDLDICIEMNCDRPLNKNWGQWVPLNISFILVLICDSGYHIEGSPPLIQCLSNGSWTHSFAVCRSELRVWTMNSIILAAFGTTILFLCLLLLKKRLHLKSNSTVFHLSETTDNMEDAMELRNIHLPIDPVYAQPFETKHLKCAQKEDYYATHIYAEPIDSRTSNHSPLLNIPRFNDKKSMCRINLKDEVQMIDNEIYQADFCSR